MKKLIFAAVLSLGSLTAFAQDKDGTKTEATEAVATQQDSFKEIKVSELPKEVTEAIKKDYPMATTKKAYVNEEKQYKLEVALENGTTGTLFADEKGNWIDL